MKYIEKKAKSLFLFSLSLSLSLSCSLACSLSKHRGMQAGRCGAVHMCPRTVHACVPRSLDWRETEQNWKKKRDAFRRTKFRDFDERKAIRGIAATSRRACRSRFDTKNRNSRINSGYVSYTETPLLFPFEMTMTLKSSFPWFLLLKKKKRSDFEILHARIFYPVHGSLTHDRGLPMINNEIQCRNYYRISEANEASYAHVNNKSTFFCIHMQ